MAGSARHVGIDLGGTAIKAGALSDSGEVLERRSVEVDLGRGPEAVLDAMAELARELGAERALGVGTPGLLDRARGIVTQSPNLRAMEGVSLRDELAQRLDLDAARIAIENDANAAAVAEHRFGAGRGERNLALVTLGTGVGGGLILDGRLYVGAGQAGEIGHVQVRFGEQGGPRCGCGNLGCLEQLVSATAARRRALERGLPGDLVLLSERARAAASPERELMTDIGRDLGRGIGVVVTLLDIRHFLIGGGFGAAFDVLAPGVPEGLRETSYGHRLDDVKIDRAALEADAGWIGAAWIGAQHPEASSSG